MNLKVWVVRGIISAGIALSASQSASANDSIVARADAGHGATCAKGHVDAAATFLAEADPPAIATQLGLKGTVKIQVDLDNRGNLQNAAMVKSSGNYAIDRSALVAVRQSSFSPEQTDCVGQSGSYAVIVEY